jgi:hypothetical protein|tara:strand:+ start:20 stop:202 length:183 start_codon:yes stop_codon:yes gene_type:complete
MEINVNTDEFRDFVEKVVREHPLDQDLHKIVRISIQTLLIMHEQGYDLPTKALAEIKKFI